MLIEADPRGEGQVRTDTHEHASPELIAKVKTVLDNPTPSQLQMPTRTFSDGGHDASWLTGFKDDYDLVGFGLLEIRSDKVIAPSTGCIENGRAPLLGSILDPVVKLLADIAQELAGHSLTFTIGVKETNYSLGLLEGLDQPVEQDSIEAAIMEFDVILMMFVEGVHGCDLRV